MNDFHTYDLSKIKQKFKTDCEMGLTEKEALKRLEINGKNEISSDKKQGIVFKFIGQFNDFLIIILIIAAAISFIIGILEGDGDLIEPVIILVIVILNALIGVFQEVRAEKSLLMLKAMSAPKARVLRDGKTKIINADSVVPGDILIIESGDVVAADARLTESNGIYVDESALTGESNPVQKNCDKVLNEDTSVGDRLNMLFSSTSVVSGRGKAVVVATGMNTEVGRVAKLILNSETPETPLQKKMLKFGRKIGILALGICLLVFIAGVVKGYYIIDMFVTSVSLAVAAIPEGLPAIVTIMLALGVSNMAKHRALVRNLPSVETLGCTDVICSDKTGTLTENKMVVDKIFTNDDKKLKLYGSLCCVRNSKNPTEHAILEYAKTELEKMEKYKIIDEVPFNSESKKMTVLCNNGKNNIIISKGAPDILLKNCSKFWDGKEDINFSFLKRREFEAKLEEFAEDGLRVIAVTYKNTTQREISENNMIFLGFFAIEDPPRGEVKAAVEKCRRAGIIPVMITGDYLKTAVTIAKKVGIYDNEKKAITGAELEKMSDEELSDTISDYCVFARVNPTHKVRIVKAWQQNGKIVAMTGDGVNDAPALKTADIGCSLGIAGTEVAKSASDMVLTDDNFATVTEAIHQGRLIFKNIKKTVRFLLSSNTGEIITIFMGMLIGFEPPLAAIQLLWVNLVTDSLPAIALGMDYECEDLMEYKIKNEDIISKRMMFKILCEGLIIGTVSLIAFYIGRFIFSDLRVARSMTFSTLSISQLLHAFNVRSDKSIINADTLKNRFLLFSVLIGIVLQVVVIQNMKCAEIFNVVALGFNKWIIVIMLSILPIIINELYKYIRKTYKKQ